MAPEDGKTDQAEHPPRQKMTLEEAQTFVGEALREAKEGDVRGCCIDGRYEANSGAISMAGGDTGLLAIGLAVAEKLRRENNIDVPDAVVRDAVFETIGGKQNFHYHTDSHNHNGGNGAGRFDGCGHCKLLKTEPELYQITPQQAVFLQETLEQLEAEGVPPAVLEGDHEERAVFITQRVWDLDALDIENPVRLTDEQVQDPSTKAWVLEHQATLPGESKPAQAFVYRRGMVDLRLRDFAKVLEAKLGGTVSHSDLHQDLKQAETTHLELTSGRLAQGKPVFEIFIEARTGRYKVVGPAE